VSTPAGAHPNVDILRAVYADLPRLADYAADEIILHRADRTRGEADVCRGVPAVLAHEKALISATQNTLVMEVEHIAANDYFGAVLGVLHASQPREITMPFCGLWRFADGRIVEHWENAYQPNKLHTQLTAPTPDLPPTGSSPTRSGG
jgi:hypothetical protein